MWLDRIQELWLSRLVSETTWGYPIVGALHVLAIALFGGAILVAQLRAFGLVPEVDVRLLKGAGLLVLLLTGLLLFASGATHYFDSTAFQIKMVLLVLLALNALAARRMRRASAVISLALWAAVIFASRAIAFL